MNLERERGREAGRRANSDSMAKEVEGAISRAPAWEGSDRSQAGLREGQQREGGGSLGQWPSVRACGVVWLLAAACDWYRWTSTVCKEDESIGKETEWEGGERHV